MYPASPHCVNADTYLFWWCRNDDMPVKLSNNRLTIYMLPLHYAPNIKIGWVGIEPNNLDLIRIVCYHYTTSPFTSNSKLPHHDSNVDSRFNRPFSYHWKTGEFIVSGDNGNRTHHKLLAKHSRPLGTCAPYSALSLPGTYTYQGSGMPRYKFP